MNLPAAILSVALAAGAAWAIHALDQSAQPDVRARALSSQANPDPAALVALYSEALRRDNSNPNRWADLGDAFTLDGRLPDAAYCFSRALTLNRRLPQIWLRDANFHFQTGATDAALDSAERVLLTVPDYDGVLFNYFDRLIGDPSRVFAKIGGNRRASVSYANHLIGVGQLEGARIAWRKLRQAGWADNSLAVPYLDLLLRSRLYAEARADWLSSTGPQAGSSNPVFNGGFERDPSGSALDWRIQPSSQFETVLDASSPHDGKRALHVRFLANSNPSYKNLTQSVVLAPGAYELDAWVRTAGITTDQCPRLEILDPAAPAHLDVRTGPFCGTHDWTLVTQHFTVSPATPLVAIRLVRQPSEKFDNKIGGDFWADSVQLVRR